MLSFREACLLGLNLGLKVHDESNARYLFESVGLMPRSVAGTIRKASVSRAVRMLLAEHSMVAIRD